MNQKIGIVGLGLIGASLAKAIKQNTECTVYGLDIDGETMKSALADHSIDGELNDFGQLDLLIVALFPKVTVEFILEHIDQMKPGSIIMDICGVKNRWFLRWRRSARAIMWSLSAVIRWQVENAGAIRTHRQICFLVPA